MSLHRSWKTVIDILLVPIALFRIVVGCSVDVAMAFKYPMALNGCADACVNRWCVFNCHLRNVLHLDLSLYMDSGVDPVSATLGPHIRFMTGFYFVCVAPFMVLLCYALWTRRVAMKSNGPPYIIQRAAAAVYTPDGQKQVRALIDVYMENARIIGAGLAAAGFTVYGGRNAPYIWVRTPRGVSSWDFFDRILAEAHVVGAPGSGFGPSGEGYFRLTAFGSKAQTAEAIERIKTRL